MKVDFENRAAVVSKRSDGVVGKSSDVVQFELEVEISGLPFGITGN